MFRTKQDPYIDRLAEVPLFRACTRKELEQIARHTEEMDFIPGEAIIKQGWISYDFFVIAEGNAEVKVDGETVALLGPGEFFGELGLLDQAPRNATVTAVTPVRAYLLSRRDLYAALDEVPGLTHKLLAGLAKRVREADSRVVA